MDILQGLIYIQTTAIFQLLIQIVATAGTKSVAGIKPKYVIGNL